jgi:hypothetical protein
VRDLLKKLPDDCSLDDVQYHLYVLQKIERGLRDADEGRVYSQKEVEKMLSRTQLKEIESIVEVHYETFRRAWQEHLSS